MGPTRVAAATITPAAGPHTYAEGAVVDVSATPAVGYVFTNWTGGVANPTSATTTVTMDADKTVTANFTVQNYDLTMAVSPSGGGTTTPAVGVTSMAPVLWSISRLRPTRGTCSTPGPVVWQTPTTPPLQ